MPKAPLTDEQMKQVEWALRELDALMDKPGFRDFAYALQDSKRREREHMETSFKALGDLMGWEPENA